MEVNREQGSVTSLTPAVYRFRKASPAGHRGDLMMVEGKFPCFELVSPNLRLVEDLVHSLDTGHPPRGVVRVARASTELIFATIESHLRGGARVELPLKGSTIKLQRNRFHRKPRYSP